MSEPQFSPQGNWFDWAVAQKPERTFVSVDGARLEVLQWGKQGDPGLLLLHGSRAQADWWSFIAPFLAENHTVVAFSFSGTGRSDWREHYSIKGMAEEAMTVAEETGLLKASVSPLFVALSIAGNPLAHIAVEFADQLTGAVFIDTLLRNPPGRGDKRPVTPSQNKFYRSREDALAHFRLWPAQTVFDERILALLAEHAVAEKKNENGVVGWTWRYDPGMVPMLVCKNEEELLAKARCPIAIVRGEKSPLVTPEIASNMRSLLPSRGVFVEIPGAGHHVLIDQPIAVITLLRTLLTLWSNETDRR